MTQGFGKPKPPEPGGNFVRLDNLVDRLVLIRPKKLEEVPSKQTGEDGQPRPPYKRMTADVVVLDGRSKLGGQSVTIPHVISDMWLTGAQLVPQVEPYLDNADEPYALGRLVLGEPNSFGTAAKVLEPFDEDDAKIAIAYLDSLKPAAL